VKGRPEKEKTILASFLFPSPPPLKRSSAGRIDPLHLKRGQGANGAVKKERKLWKQEKGIANNRSIKRRLLKMLGKNFCALRPEVVEKRA